MDVILIAGAAFTVDVEGKDMAGNTKVCRNVAVGGDCKLHNIPINHNFTVKYHCIPNKYINYQPVVAGDLKLRTWGTCWTPEYIATPEMSVVDVTRVRRDHH